MAEAAQSSILGRCPACGRSVTLPTEARSTKVACPVCRHQAPGAAFADAEAPLPVLLVSGAGRSIAADEARTHLLLDVPILDEGERDEATHGAVEDAQTHLVLGPADVQEDDAVDAALNDDPRTRLLSGPLSLAGAKNKPLDRGVAWLQQFGPPLLRLGAWLDEALHGRWLVALAALAVLCGFVAPTLDYLMTEGRSTLGFFSWVFGLIAFGVFGMASCANLRSDEGNWEPGLALRRLVASTRLTHESFEQLAQAPRYLKLCLVGQVLGLLALVGLSWAGLLSGLRWLFGLGATPSTLPFVSGLLLLCAVGVLAYASRSAPVLRFSLQDSGNALTAAAELPPIIDVSEPLSESISSGATTLHRTLIALSTFRARPWPDEAAYRAALARHLQFQLPNSRIERERWVGRSRHDGVLDLVIDGVLVIGVRRGFHESSAERALAQVNGYVRTWSGKPMLLAIFEAPRAALAGSPEATLLLTLHQKFGLVSVRMPTYS